LGKGGDVVRASLEKEKKLNNTTVPREYGEKRRKGRGRVGGGTHPTSSPRRKNLKSDRRKGRRKWERTYRGGIFPLVIP